MPHIADYAHDRDRVQAFASMITVLTAGRAEATADLSGYFVDGVFFETPLALFTKRIRRCKSLSLLL
jgi:hypothetical protein